MYATQFSPPRRFLLLIAFFFLQLILWPAISLYLTTQVGGGSFTETTLQPNISIASVPVGGHTYEEARQKLIAALETRKRAEIRFVLDDRSYPINLSKLNVTFDVEATLQKAFAKSDEQGGFFSTLWGGARQAVDVPMQVTFDRSELSKQLVEISKAVDRPAASATGKVSGDRITIVPEEIGYRTDIEKSLDAFDQFLATQLAGTTGEVKLETEQDTPEILRKDIESIDHLVAKQSFPIAIAGVSGEENLSKLIARLSGSIVLPGQTFSFLEKTGPYTQENGYMPVAVLSDEQVADRLGGGATQAATALYQSLLKSHLSIIERHAAVRPVSYTEAGLEAMVSGDGLDLRFVNQTKNPVYIHAELKNNQVSVSLFSGKGEVAASALTTQRGQAIEPDTIIRVDRSLAPNQEVVERKGSEGFTVAVYRTWKDANGSEVKEKISEDYYKPLHNIVAVGPVYEKDKVKAQSSPNDQTQEAAPEDFAGDEGTITTPPPDIPTEASPPADSGSASTGEPLVENGIIYQN